MHYRFDKIIRVIFVSISTFCLLFGCINNKQNSNLKFNSPNINWEMYNDKDFDCYVTVNNIKEVSKEFSVLIHHKNMDENMYINYGKIFSVAEENLDYDAYLVNKNDILNSNNIEFKDKVVHVDDMLLKESSNKLNSKHYIPKIAKYHCELLKNNKTNIGIILTEID